MKSNRVREKKTNIIAQMVIVGRSGVQEGK